MLTLYVALAALLAGAAAFWRIVFTPRVNALTAELAKASADRDTALSTVATRDRELQAARADVLHLREQLRQIAGRDPVAAADDLDDAFAGLRRPR